ncbi:hypothetical protein [Stackebrandtia albiflava]|uniref:hypothetical protein n=1 Tax=Stackebrandtia albiflava TaxID=406432 RepID=UPI0011BE731E|nr:hypothetical protein [Stackebrandtia albiflava]
MSYLAAGAALLLLGVVLLGFQVFWQLPRHWDGRAKEREASAYRYLPYSEEFRSGLRRQMPVTILVPFVLFVVSVAMIINDIFGRRESMVILLVLAGISIACLLAFFLGSYLVIYRNRPKCVVAPHYRNEPGVVQVRRESGRLVSSRRRLLWEVCIWAAVAALGMWVLLRMSRP